jgi:hypothetical protein
MKTIPKDLYQTADELDQRIQQRWTDAALLPPGLTRQSVLKEIAQLRMYANVKRWAAAEQLPAK